MPVAKVDDAAAAEAGEVQRIVAAGIPDGQRRIVIFVEIEDVASGGGIEAVNGIARARRHVGTVFLLRDVDVMQHRGLRIAEEQQVPVHKARAGFARRPVGHDRVLLGILRVFGTAGIVGRARAVIRARVAEADRVAQFMDEGRQAVAVVIQRAVGTVELRIVDEDVAEELEAAGIGETVFRVIGVGLPRIGGVGELDVRAIALLLDESRGDDIVPERDRFARGVFLRIGEFGKAFGGAEVVFRAVVKSGQSVLVEEGKGDRAGIDLLRCAAVDLFYDLVQVGDGLAAIGEAVPTVIVEIEIVGPVGIIRRHARFGNKGIVPVAMVAGRRAGV